MDSDGNILMMSLIVDVEQGRLQGKLCDHNGKKYYSFEGIPYAKPPTGKLRFREPQQPEYWSGIRDATKPGNKCIQVNPVTNGLIGSEDCLYLNIYTPNLPEEEMNKLPVIFFTHGGRLLFGYGDYYRPEYFIDQNAILVTINYRLHVLGFLCLNIYEAAGNMALKDTVMALTWVKKNIRNFNGDDNNITIFGESAGAAVMTSYLTSEMTNGLFNKIIAFSGTSLSDLFLVHDDPIAKAKHLVSLLGQELHDVKSLHEYLVNLPIEELVFATAVIEASRPPATLEPYFHAVVESKFEGMQRFFSEYPIVAFRENRYKKVPILFGMNTHEGALFLKYDKKGNIIYENNLQYFIPRFWFIKPESPKALKITQDIHNFYFNGEVIDDNKKLQYINLLSDAYFNRDILYFLDKFGKNCNELYLFQLSHLGNINTRVMKKVGIKGTTHGDSLQYVFYKKNKAETANEKDKIILNILHETICNFAKTGLPTWSKKSVEWAPYTPKKRSYMDFGETPQLLENIGSDYYSFWCKLGERSKL